MPLYVGVGQTQGADHAAVSAGPPNDDVVHSLFEFGSRLTLSKVEPQHPPSEDYANAYRGYQQSKTR